MDLPFASLGSFLVVFCTIIVFVILVRNCIPRHFNPVDACYD